VRLTQIFSGYPRLLSGDMLIPTKRAAIHNEGVLSSEGEANPEQYAANKFRRFYASFPIYPFRNVNPRDADRLLKGSSEFDHNSPMIPAHTQINAKFVRLPKAKLINWMFPSNLDYDKGSTSRRLTQQQRNDALEFTVMKAAGNEQYSITKVDVVINDLYIQVGPSHKKGVCSRFYVFYFQVTRLRYKGISPERPLSNVYSCMRVRFTPLQKVSLHTYDLAWDTEKRPATGYLGFIQ